MCIHEQVSMTGLPGMSPVLEANAQVPRFLLITYDETTQACLDKTEILTAAAPFLFCGDHRHTLLLCQPWQCYIALCTSLSDACRCQHCMFGRSSSSIIVTFFCFPCLKPRVTIPGIGQHNVLSEA